MAWYSDFIDPTTVKGLLFFSLILYLINLAYETYIAPHLSGYVDNLDERTRQRIIEQRKKKEEKEKAVQEQLKRIYTGGQASEEQDMETIKEEGSEDEKDGAGKESEIPTKSKKNKKKAASQGKAKAE